MLKARQTGGSGSRFRSPRRYLFGGYRNLCRRYSGGLGVRHRFNSAGRGFLAHYPRIHRRSSQPFRKAIHEGDFPSQIAARTSIANSGGPVVFQRHSAFRAAYACRRPLRVAGGDLPHQSVNCPHVGDCRLCSQSPPPVCHHFRLYAQYRRGRIVDDPPNRALLGFS